MAANAIASLLMDRFVSASSADDARSSLERILEALEANKQPPLDDEKDEPPRLAPEMIWSDQDMLNALRQVLHTGNHKQNDMEVPVDEGASLVCKIYMEMVEQEANKSPLLDKDEALLECLIDVISSDPSNNDDPDAITVVSMYTRVLALQLLTKLCVKRPSKAQAQLLQAPNGLNRLGDLLQVHQEEIIRNEALLLAQVIAEWPSCAKIWMFAEVADQVILLAIEEGGLTGGNLLVQDCLDLLFRLWKHDPSLADLVFQSQTITQNLPLLLDLRQGTEFRNPPSKTKTAKKDDDLDDILKSAEDKAAESKEDEVVVPRLTGAEEKVISKTLDILSLLLESDGLKQSVWIRELQLCSFTWELALVAPPPPQVPFVCSVPSPTLQQKALETVALYFNDTTTLERHAGLDRLLYLVCTGGFGTSLMEKMGISQAALHVIRQTVSVESANQMLMYTLAPPMTMGDEDGGNTPPPPTVVHKLLNTVAENLTATEGIDPERRKVFLAGALGGLSVFLTDQTSREVMLRITTGTAESDEGDDPDDPAETTTTTSLVESILHAVGTMAETENPENPFLSTTLLRFLCHWTVETPAVVQTILSSNQSSIVLSALLGIKTKTQSHKKGVAVLGKLLLGLSMEYMGEDEGKCGGWTRASIMELIAKKSGGVSKFTSSLEQFKSVNDFGDTMPWSVCKLEFKVWSQWFANCVLLVRKRVVQELTGSGDGEEEDEEDEGLEGSIPRDTAGSGSARSLQKVVFQQSKEIDELQQSLDTANATIKTQHHDLSEYKRRVESAPSQLDTMLNEYLAKIAELENTVSSLHEKNRLDEEKHTSESKARDDRIALLEKELEESRAREKESRDEADTVREDMESLSQAYTNLEQEYRHQQQQQQGRQESGVSSTETTTTVSEQQPGEPDQEGAAGGHAGSTEISALRAENERLRNDAQAADKWMSMAVEKMQAMGQQNAGLQAELSTLKDGQAMNQQHLELQQHNQTLFAEKEAIVRQQSQMQAHLDGVVNENQGLRGALNQGQAQYMELERQLTGAREELQSTVTALEEARSQGAAERADLDNQLTELRSELESLSSERARLQEQLDEIQKKSAEGEVQAQASAQAVATYEAALTSKDEEIMKLQNAMAGQSSSVEAQKESHAQEVEALQKSIAELQGQIEASNTEVERIRTNGQEEIYKCESRIRELEAKQTTGLGAQSAASDEALKKKDGEISELTAANDAAQEWMARAVDHHNMLSQQHAKLGTENAALLAQIKELKEKVAQDSATISKAKALEEESLAKANRIRDSEASLEACKLELQRVQAEVTLLQNQKLELASSAAEVQQLQNQLDNLRASHDEQVAACESARQELVLEKESKEEALAKLEAANKEHSDSRVNAEDEIRTLKERMEALDAALKDKSATFDELNAQIAAERESSKSANDKRESLRMETEQLSEELELLRSKSETAEEDTQKVIDLTKELEIAKGTNESLLRSQEDDKMTISRLSDEIASMRSAKETLTVQQTPPAAATETPAAEAFFSVAPQSQPVAAHDVFSAGGSAAAASESLAPPQPGNPSGALQLFASGPPASEGVSARDVFGSAPSEQSAGDFFSGGPRVSDTAASTNAEGLQRTADLERQLQQSSEQVRQLEQQLREARAELEQTKTQVAEKGTGGPERISELELAVNQLQQQLKESEDAKTQQVLMVESLEKKSSELSLLVESSGAQGNVQKELEETTGKLAQALAKLEEDNDVVVEWEERVAGLESAIKDMEIQLTEQEENATTVIAKWQESCNALEEKNAELLSALESCGVGEEGVISREALALLHERLRETEASLASARAHMKDDDDVVLRWQERVAELEAAGKEFDSQLSQQELEAKTAIAQWQESCTSLQEQNTELLSKHEQMQQELNEAKARILEDEDVVAKWQDRTSALEEAIKDLEAQLNEQEEDANNVISMWQQSCSTLEEQKAELAQNLETSNEAETNIRAQLQESQQALEESQQNVTKGEEALAQSVEAEKNLKAQFEETQQALEENKEKVLKGEEDLAKHMEASLETEKSLRADLEEIKQAFEESSEQASLAEAALSDSRAECGKLAYKASDLEKRLTESEEESKAAIETLQEKCTSLEGGKSEVFQQLETTKDNIEKLQAQLQQQQESEEESKAAIETLQEKCTSLEAEKSEVVQQVETTKDNIAKLQAQLQQQQESLKDDETAVSQWQVRATELEAVVKELEDQLAEQEEEAQNVIAMWQESCTKIGDEKSELEQRLESSEASVASVSGELQATKQLLDEANNKLQDKEEEIRTQQGRVAELESNLEEMRSKLAQQQEQAKAEIEKWQESISSLEDLKEEKLKEDEDVVLQWQERATELEAVVKDLETQLNEQEEEANNVIAMWQESCNTLEATNQELAQSSEKLEEQLESSKAAASSAAELLKTTEVDKKELQERVNELETASRGLEAKLSDEDEKAKSLIADWQEKVASLQAAKDEVTVALTTAKDNQQSMEQELASLQSQMKETEGELTVARESLSEKEAMVASLEGRLQAMIESQDLDASEKDRELDSLRGQVSTLQLELDKTEASLKEAQANLAHNEKAVPEWEKRANEFETSVKELEEQLTEQENEATNAISDWSDRVQLLEKEKGDLAQSLAAALNRSKELTDENKSSASSASQLADAKAALEEKQLVVEDLNGTFVFRYWTHP
ncbi:Inherit from KOG: Kinesin family member [Seminavis robusta]|uniref:Inherit from KOG: Kinesin family member n=1 Tax=Seminavis robusta TaxID=568900 RepID=A0A9N8E3E7_9STRA|nr:Inherit from KOG: Kinesin family member [Seminavis robusta]|eukprot:Sro462_g147910.1 Inherit from KOG: Kinesin family member (2689) ;mRNA; r:2206-11091